MAAMATIVRYDGTMRSGPRKTQSYSQIPFANEADKAMLATIRRSKLIEIDRRVTVELSSMVADDPEKWACARATDLMAEGAQLRSAITDPDIDP